MSTDKTLTLAPAVFAVNRTYHIMVYSETPAFMWVKIGDKCYYDESNGVFRSDTIVHRMIVPMEELDALGEYTICERILIERKPYFTETADVNEYTYSFRPVKEGNVRAYHIGDAHNWVAEPVAASKTFGEFDFLILNGDIPDHSGAIKNCITIFEIASAITHGNIPVVFARGNHDMRGIYAEHFGEYTPSDNGKTYYTFRLGSIWGLILDCGEDKVDEHEEYGFSICCHAFRERQTQFIKDVIARADSEYAEEGITHKVVVCHNPFTYILAAPFDIENDLYQEWVELLNENIKPDVIMSAHKHKFDIYRPGGEGDHRGQSCPTVIGSVIKRNEQYYAGAGYTFDENGITVTFTDNQGEVVGEERI